MAGADTEGMAGATAGGGAGDGGRVVGGGPEGARSRDAAAAALDAHDAHPALDEAGALLRTGPTGTNVNDLRVSVIPAGESRSEGTK